MFSSNVARQRGIEKLPAKQAPRCASGSSACLGTRLMFPQLGRLFIILGVVFLALGLWLTFAPHLSFGKFGRLPGDIHIKRDNFTFYFPITTCILVSLLLTLLFSILSRK
jgi:Protein of unknown function (DUF2905)